MKNDLKMNSYNYVYEKKNYDPIVKEVKPFQAKDGSFHATMEDVEKANEEYFRREKKRLNLVKEQLNYYINGVHVEPQTATYWDKTESEMYRR